MDKNFVTDEVNKHFEQINQCVAALKFAKAAIPRDGSEQLDVAGVYALVNVLTDSLASSVELAREDLIEYMSSWKDY